MNALTTQVPPGCSIAQALDTVSEALDEAGAYFGHGTDNAWDEAVQLVLGALGLPPDTGREVAQQTLNQAQADAVNDLLSRRLNERLPLPYLLGEAWFAGLSFKCDERALVPRSPLAELILDGFAPWYTGPGPTRVLDLCCGGGSIGLAVAHYFPEARVDLLDLDEAALDLARENAVRLGVESRVEILRSDLVDAIAPGTRYDIILSNPPYVNAPDLAAMPAEYRHEPALALGSGADGLDLTHRILAQAGKYLHDHGLLVVELGYSWPALEVAYPNVPFTWLELSAGGEGVFLLDAQQWQHYSESWRR